MWLCFSSLHSWIEMLSAFFTRLYGQWQNLSSSLHCRLAFVREKGNSCIPLSGELITQGHPFVFIQQNRKFPNHSPLILKSGENLLPPQDNKDTVRRGADFPSPYYMCEVTSRSEGSLPLKHECSRTARWPAGKSKLRRWTWKLKASGFENEEMCDVGPLGIIGAP